LLADRPENVRVMKVKRGGYGDSFTYSRTGAERADKTFTVMKGGHVHTGKIKDSDDYALVLYVKDGGDFDLDLSATRVMDPAVIVKTAKPIAENQAKNGGGSGGCGVTSGSLLLAALAVAVIARRTTGRAPD
jgi:hypothetical protein